MNNRYTRQVGNRAPKSTYQYPNTYIYSFTQLCLRSKLMQCIHTVRPEYGYEKPNYRLKDPKNLTIENWSQCTSTMFSQKVDIYVFRALRAHLLVYSRFDSACNHLTSVHPVNQMQLDVYMYVHWNKCLCMHDICYKVKRSFQLISHIKFYSLQIRCVCSVLSNIYSIGLGCTSIVRVWAQPLDYRI